MKKLWQISLIFRYGERMTAEERLSLELLEKLFGEDMYKYAVFVFTNGKSFKKIQEKKVRGAEGDPEDSFEEYILRDKNSKEVDAIGPHVARCAGGAVLFENLLAENYKEKMANDSKVSEKNC